MKKLVTIPNKLFEQLQAEADKLNIPLANYIIMVLSEYINKKSVSYS